MSENRNKTLANRIYAEMWNRGNLNIAEEIFADPAGVIRFVQEFKNVFPDLHHQVEEMITEANKVVIRFSAAGTHMGSWKGYPPSGRPIRYTGVTIVSIENGKIAHHHTWWDDLEVIQQISEKGIKDITDRGLS